MAIRKRKLLKYFLLPEILPRIGRLFASGFSHIAFTMAMLFEMVRLLPRHHAYLQPENFGRFGIRHVIYEAARNLKFDRHHTDQIFIFATVMIGALLLVFQLGLVLFTIIAQPAFAMPYAFGDINFAGWFTLDASHTYYPFTENNDIALMLLDRVFGVEGIFNSCISTGNPCIGHDGQPVLSTTTAFTYPTILHLALHDLFRLYSVGISIISILIIAYYVITIIGETAVSGTPFGQRFNRVWAPVRLIIFFAMLAPLNFGGQNAGLNGAQLITLWTAKFGSNFASNAWGVFNTSTARVAYNRENLVAIPGVPELGNMAQFWSVAHACIHGEKTLKGRDIGIYMVRSSPAPTATNVVSDSATLMDSGALAFSNYGPVHIVVGELDPVRHNNYRGNVAPICGEIVIPITNSRGLESAGGMSGPRAVFQFYWYNILGYADPDSAPIGYSNDLRPLASCTLDRSVGFTTSNCDPTDGYGSYVELVREHLDRLKQSANNQISWILDQEYFRNDFTITDDLVGRGWAGAAIWYNRIADVNGSIASSIYARPYALKWPMVMENVRNQQLQNSDGVSADTMFNPSLPDRAAVSFDENYDDILASVYYNLYTLWSDSVVIADPETALTGNAFMDTVNSLFGTAGLFSMREPAPGLMSTPHDGNNNVHPLALLSSLGRSMVEAAVINLGIATGATIGGGLLSITEQFDTVKILLNTASKFYTKVAATTIMVGVILGYILPLMPFIYFFFAIGGWVKTIFEAMVAMPIWALGHLRIDGQGVMGPGATNGYYLMFDIFIRPILILIGLISSVLIFGAMVQILNQIFDIMVANVGGYKDSAAATPAEIEFYRGPIDELFYSVIYAAICYMMGISSFKMIDAIPNNILRWMGSSVATFKELQGDTAGQLAGTVYQKGNIGVSYVTGALEGNSGRLAAMIGSR